MNNPHNGHSHILAARLTRLSPPHLGIRRLRADGRASRYAPCAEVASIAHNVNSVKPRPKIGVCEPTVRLIGAPCPQEDLNTSKRPQVTNVKAFACSNPNQHHESKRMGREPSENRSLPSVTCMFLEILDAHLSQSPLLAAVFPTGGIDS